jgi:hypothetical protein
LPTLKKIFILLAVAQTVFFSSTGIAFSQETAIMSNSQIPKEPGWKDPSYRGWEITSVNGLIATYYDLKRDGTLNYMVMRRIVHKEDASDMSVESAIETARRDNLSVYISTPVIYFASRYPLFYCLGVDSRHNCENMWIDVQEDGLNGNEVLHTLPEPKIPVR